MTNIYIIYSYIYEGTLGYLNKIKFYEDTLKYVSRFNILNILKQTEQLRWRKVEKKLPSQIRQPLAMGKPINLERRDKS